MLVEAQSAYRTIRVQSQETGFGAEVSGVDLSRPLEAAVLAEVKDAWARHAVLAFPDQPLTLDQLEAFTLQFGPFGDDPYVAPMPGHPNVLEVRREPDEKVTPLAVTGTPTGASSRSHRPPPSCGLRSFLRWAATPSTPMRAGPMRRCPRR